MLPVLRAVHRAGGRGRAAHLVLLATLALLLRLGALGSAVAWDSPYFSRALVALVAVGIAHRAFRVWLHVDVVSGLLRAVLRGTLGGAVQRRPGEEALVVVSEAVHHGAIAVVDLSTSLVADGVAAIVTAVVLSVLLPAPVLAVAAFAILVGGTAAFVARRASQRRASQTYEAHVRNLDVLADAFEGGAEVIASGARADFIERGEAGIDGWKQLALRSEALGVLTGRLPFLAAVVLGGVVLFAARGLDADAVRWGVLLLGAAPVIVSLLRSTGDLARLEPRVAALVALTADMSSAVLPSTGAPKWIAWEAVSHAFGDHRVLDSVDLEVPAGEVIAVVGPNGSGKSTLLRIACGLLLASSGHFTIDGSRRGWGTQLRHLPQHPYLLPRRTVKDALAFPFALLDEETALKAMQRTGFSIASKVLTDALSAGERQRLALARILSREGEVYLLDEPDANLDAAGVTMVAGILRELADAGKIVVVAAHTPEVIAAADRVVHLENGRVTSIEERSGTPSVRRKVAES